MTTIKSYTDLEQSKKLAKILPIESADMAYYFMKDSGHLVNPSPFILDGTEVREGGMFTYLNCWSLTALLNILHSRAKDIPSLSGGDYKDGKYISDWCLDYEFENGDYQKTFADNPVDACVAMIEKLRELNLL